MSEKPKFRKFTLEEKMEWSKRQQEQIKNTLVDGIKNKLNSEEWKNYLLLSQNFANYSPTNKMLVYLQNPEATFIKGAKTWQKEFERNVVDYNKCIYIMAPQTAKSNTVRYLTPEELQESEYGQKNIAGEPREEDGKIPVYVSFTYFKPVKVYDVSNTEGKELPPHSIVEQLKEQFDSKEEFEMVLSVLESISPCEVSYSNPSKDSILRDGALGYYNSIKDTITVSSELSDEQTVKVLVHEIAHSMLHGDIMRVEGLDSTDKISSRSDKELQAESVAYLVCQQLGIETGGYSFGYIATWLGEQEDVEKAFTKLSTPIFKCAETICKDFDREYKLTKEAWEEDIDNTYIPDKSIDKDDFTIEEDDYEKE